MGMKSKNGHFPGVGTGGPSVRNGRLPFKLDIQFFAKMPKQKAQIMHIMRNDEGHLIDTPKNRKLIINMTNDKGSFLGIDKYGNEVYAKIEKGTQYWAYVRDNVIQNAGANRTKHRNFNEIIVKKGGK